jgi:predicted Rossmann fold flavoprotein
MKKRVIIVGGGAAGFMAAITCAESNPNLEVLLLERGENVLEKVLISGGGRCNVTHAEFIPRELVKSYPRGHRELMGPFSRFACGDTMAWFEERGVPLKIEDDGRVFPVSNKSTDIANCLIDAASKAGVQVITKTRAESIEQQNGRFVVHTPNKSFEADKLMLASGSSTAVWTLLSDLGHQVIAAVPSLFTFKIKDDLLEGLAGISLPFVTVSLPAFKMEQTDNFLITHRGISGFATLKLSSRAARELHDAEYRSKVWINFEPGFSAEQLFEQLLDVKKAFYTKNVAATKMGSLPSRLWQRIVMLSGIHAEKRWAETSTPQLRELAQRCARTELTMQGKDTNKDEFVTAGGVDLSEIDFKRFESKRIPNLFLAGEVLNIDALTGGFNFQAAWTGGYLAGKAMAGVE